MGQGELIKVTENTIIPERECSIFMFLEHFISQDFIDTHSTARIHYKTQSETINPIVHRFR